MLDSSAPTVVAKPWTSLPMDAKSAPTGTWKHRRRTRFPTAPTASIFLPINLQERDPMLDSSAPTVVENTSLFDGR